MKSRVTVIALKSCLLVCMLTGLVNADSKCLKLEYTETVFADTYGDIPPSHAYVIQHQEVTVQLTGSKIQNLDILKIGYKGEFESIEERAKAVLRRLRNAIDLMKYESRAHLMKGVYEGNPAIYVRGPWDGECSPQGVLIMAVYPEDANKYGHTRSQNSVADYLMALIEAHFTVFYKIPKDAKAIDNLWLSRNAREGKVFIYIFLQAIGYAKEVMKSRINLGALQSAIDMSDIDQRLRLNTMAHYIPVDWTK